MSEWYHLARQDLVILAVFAAAVGWVFLSVVFTRVEAGLRLALAPAAGLVLLGAELPVLSLVHLGWDLQHLIAPWAILGVVGWRRVLPARPPRLRLPRINPFAALLWLVLLGCLAGVTLKLLSTPLDSYDAIAFWHFKAKVFELHQAVNQSGFKPELMRHLDYPPLYPLMINVFYLVTGGSAAIQGLADVFSKTVTAVFAASALLAVPAALSRRQPAVIAAATAAAAVFSLSSWPYLITGNYMGYVDYLLGLVMMLSVVLLWRWLEDRESQYLWLGLGFAAAASVIKNEGLVFLVLALLAVVAVRVERRQFSLRTLARLLPFLLPGLIWKGWALSQHYASDLAGGARHFGSLLEISGYILSYPARDIHFGFALLALVWLTALAATRRLGAQKYLVFMVLVQFAVYCSVYLIVPGNVHDFLETSFSRLVAQITPSIAFLLGAVAPRYRRSW